MATEYAYTLLPERIELIEENYMTMNCNITLGYDYDIWFDWGKKNPITVDTSPKSNTHILVCGMSGGGKSYCENIIFSKLALVNSKSEIYFADYKQDDQFAYLRGCVRYYPYKESLNALNTVYEKLHKRQTNEDSDRHPIMLIWDEYMANMLALQSENKQAATLAMNKVSEILMIGRSLSVRFFTACQRPDASAFPAGCRLNYGITLVLGSPVRSIYEMLLPPEYIAKIGDREFRTGEGVVLLQGSILRFIKIPIIQNVDRMREICIKALS